MLHLPEITETLYVKNREAWRKWLEKNHSRKKEIWLIYYKVSSGKKRIPYADAVEEALCFGWIDTTVKSIDDEKYVQLFVPRKRKSNWSELNLTRAKKMIDEGKMTKAGLEKLGDALEKRKSNSRKITPRTPSDLLKELRKNPKALANYGKWPPSHKRHYIWWMLEAKQAETRKRREKKIFERALANKKLGEA